jgi:hypothetical protein
MQLFPRIQNRNFFMTPNNKQNKTTNIRVPWNKIVALVVPPSSPGRRNDHDFSSQKRNRLVLSAYTRVRYLACVWCECLSVFLQPGKHLTDFDEIWYSSSL